MRDPPKAIPNFLSFQGGERRECPSQRTAGHIQKALDCLAPTLAGIYWDPTRSGAVMLSGSVARRSSPLVPPMAQCQRQQTETESGSPFLARAQVPGAKTALPLSSAPQLGQSNSQHSLEGEMGISSCRSSGGAFLPWVNLTLELLTLELKGRLSSSYQSVSMCVLAASTYHPFELSLWLFPMCYCPHSPGEESSCRGVK